MKWSQATPEQVLEEFRSTYPMHSDSPNVFPHVEEDALGVEFGQNCAIVRCTVHDEPELFHALGLIYLDPGHTVPLPRGIVSA